MSSRTSGCSSDGAASTVATSVDGQVALTDDAGVTITWGTSADSATKARVVELRSQLQGRLATVAVESGDPVAKGQLLADAYNAVSIGAVLPIGGEDLASYAGSPALVRADGTEPFDTVAAGESVVEHPAPGEVVWRDDLGVTCRMWNWRQCRRTLITESTTEALFVLDGLPELGPEGLEAAGDALEAALASLSPGAVFARRVMD